MPLISTVDGKTIKNNGWKVTFAGIGINLALGILYSWSIIGSAIEKSGWGWSAAQRSLPYSIACLVFCLVMVPAGRMQDKLGPRLVASIGGLLVGIGMILTSFSNSVTGFIIGFGVLAGAGIGFGYAATTPPAVKWFPASKTGMITGLVVSGFGLASIYIAPLSNLLINSFGIPRTLLIFGIGFLIVVVSLSQLLSVPPKGFTVSNASLNANEAAAPVKPAGKDFTSLEILKTWQFYLLWFMFACGAGAGLMVISVAKSIAGKAGVGVIAVVALAIGNGLGRISAGMLSDKIGRKQTLFMFLLLQSAAVFVLSVAGTHDGIISSGIVLICLSALIGANYGSNLSLFPSITKDFFGLKNFGMNYGLVFTAWGVGGFLLAQLAGIVYDKTQTFTFAFYCSVVLLIIAGIMVFLLKPPKKA
ncbi:MAG: hypothetical protein A2252_11400 [Elusimicrobia bacterium RIFOXYA2_FULL_39_19]|nr:MAG: hypothetical protein A2252_11400 [Elusimicrobia bacterium RIFOXYA2_FULL_39_19]